MFSPSEIHSTPSNTCTYMYHSSQSMLCDAGFVMLLCDTDRATCGCYILLIDTRNFPSIFLWYLCSCLHIRALLQYPIRRLVRSRKVSNPRDLYWELCDRSEIWQAPRQQCCQHASEISKRWDKSNYQSRGEILQYDVLLDIETGPRPKGWDTIGTN